MTTVHAPRPTAPWGPGVVTPGLRYQAHSPGPRHRCPVWMLHVPRVVYPVSSACSASQYSPTLSSSCHPGRSSSSCPTHRHSTGDVPQVGVLLPCAASGNVPVMCSWIGHSVIAVHHTCHSVLFPHGILVVLAGGIGKPNVLDPGTCNKLRMVA